MERSLGAEREPTFKTFFYKYFVPHGTIYFTY
jgi:hypothetical protein